MSEGLFCTDEFRFPRTLQWVVLGRRDVFCYRSPANLWKDLLKNELFGFTRPAMALLTAVAALSSCEGVSLNLRER